MDRNERINDNVNATQQALKGWQQKIWTALPGIVDSFSATALTAVVQPAIQAQLRNPQGTWSNTTISLCLDCPVLFPFCAIGGMTFPVAKGDEGLLVFSSRCIDAWWQSGGVQPQAEYRMHDLSDGFFIPGAFSQPHVLADFNTQFPELRNAAGTVKLSMISTGFRITGDLDVTGEITRGFGGADQVTLGQHAHPNNGSPPTPGT